MKKKIIAISGKQYSGKDTVAKLILKRFPSYTRVGIGDAIKIEYGRQKGLTFEQIEMDKHLYRSDLIELGNWGRAQDAFYWLKKIVELDYDVIVPDMRVLEELNIFKNEKAFLLRVEANKESRALRGKITNEEDSTETVLDSFTGWDFVVDNSRDYESLKEGVPTLYDKIEKYHTSF